MRIDLGQMMMVELKKWRLACPPILRAPSSRFLECVFLPLLGSYTY
jgi:hypothetical protein